MGTRLVKKVLSSIWFGRLFLLLIGLSLLMGGLGTLLAGGLHYLNYWGGAVFAPFAIALGLFVLGVLVFKWRTLNERLPTKKMSSKAARLARKAERTRFPIDDFRKW